MTVATFLDEIAVGAAATSLDESAMTGWYGDMGETYLWIYWHTKGNK
jgi:hypothetical protein